MPPTPEALHVRLLGAPRILLGGRDQPQLRAALLVQLIAYLILANGQEVERRDLALALWPGTAPDTALMNLRQLPRRLKQALPGWEQWFRLERGTLAWAPVGPVEVDIFEIDLFLARPGAPSPDEALALARGPLLDGVEAGWLTPWRRRLAAKTRALLLRAGDAAEAAERPEQALALLTRAVALGLADEATVQRVARLHQRLGDHGAAQRGPGAPRLAPAPAARAAPPAFADAASRGFVGRAAALATLDQAWRAAAQGSARILAIRGAPGSGKTALAAHFVATRATASSSPRPTVVAARCALADTPYAALASLAARLPLDRCPPVWKAELSRLVPELRDAEPDLPVLEPLSDPLARIAFLRRVSKAFLTQAPLLLVLDDAAACDPASARWLEALVAENPAAAVLVLLVGASGAPLAGASALPLGPLDAAEAEALAQAVSAPGAPVAPGIAAAGGNPRLITLLARGAAGQAGAAALARGWVARLGPEASEVAEVLAVLGEPARPRLLAALLPEAPRRSAGIDALIQAGLVTEGAGGFAFCQGLTREAVLAGLLPGARRDLHRRAAQQRVAEALHAPEDRAALFAHLAALDGAEAAQIALGAAALYAHPGAYEVAWALLEEGARLLAASPDREVAWALRLRRLEVAAELGWKDRVEADLRLASAEVQRSPDPQRRRLELLGTTREIMYTLGDLNRALGFARAWVELAEQIAPREAPEAWVRLSGGLAVSGDRVASEAALDAAAAAAARVGGGEVLVTLQAQRAANERYLLRLTRALRTIRGALAAAEAFPSQALLSRCRGYEALILFSLGRLEEADQVIDALLDHPGGVPQVVAALLIVRKADVRLLLGRAAEALALLDAPPLTGAPLPDDLAHRRGVTRAQVLLALGRAAEAEAELDATERVPNHTALSRFSLEIARVQLHLALGRDSAAEAAARAALPSAREYPIYRVELLEGLARARLAQGDPAEAVALLREALSLGEPTPPGEAPPPHRLALEARLREALERLPNAAYGTQSAPCRSSQPESSVMHASMSASEP